MMVINRRPEIDRLSINFLYRAGNKFLLFNEAGRLIYSAASRTEAESARNLICHSSPVAEIKYLSGELCLSFGTEALEFFS